MNVLTFDIGGANTKRLAFDSDTGSVASEIHYFPFWQKKEEFGAFLAGLAEDCDRVGITMTAELSDVFATKEEGVQFIVDVCEDVFESPLYLTLDRTLINADEIKNPADLAAANFLASTYYLEREFGEGLLIDCGSTTTDIIPFDKGRKYPKTDLERLKACQLLYTGLLRTPVTAIVDGVPFDGKMVPLSSEYFAITADVYNVLGIISENEYSCDTPDGKGKSKDESMQRIARVLCADLDEIGKRKINEICEYVSDRQVERIADTIERHGGKRACIAGFGRVLAKEACERTSLEATDLQAVTPAYDNLPCLGLAHMLAKVV
ncbi:H4MPT-linked C1 transfer pathway protein [archaeon]|nr:H4MPT-linked C1 transfer pathway protein [archaeon]